MLSDWFESLTISVYKEGQQSSCDNQRGISLTNILCKILATTKLQCLITTREVQTRETQAGFRTGSKCKDQILTLWQIPVHIHTYRRPTIVVFLDFKAVSDFVDREVLCHCLSLKGVPKKNINLINAYKSNTSGRVSDYGKLLSELATSSSVCQRCPPPSLLFNVYGRPVMSAGASVGLKNVGDDQIEAEYRSMKSFTIGMSHVSRYKLPDQGLCECHNQWLVTLNDMAQNCL